MSQVCKRCVMSDIGDDTIKFDENGICSYCSYALSRKDSVYFPNADGQKKLENLLIEIKEYGKNKKYDCLMGISGGLDSAYLAYLGAKKWKLRILCVHINDGFDTPIALQNIESLCKNCGLDLITRDINEEQFNNLTASFIRAGVSSICIPQDNVLFSELYDIAKENKLKYFLSGTNFALESILQRGNTHFYADKVHIKDIFKKFGKGKIDDLKLISLYDKYIKFKYFEHLKFMRPLDFIEYNKENAIKELESVGFYYYGLKHNESILTRFTQNYYLPTKFGVDKRKSHFSSLIVVGQMTREQAIEELSKPIYDEAQLIEDKRFILNKLKINDEEFNQIMQQPPIEHTNFKVSFLCKFSKLARKIRKVLSD